MRANRFSLAVAPVVGFGRAAMRAASQAVMLGHDPVTGAPMVVVVMLGLVVVVARGLVVLV